MSGSWDPGLKYYVIHGKLQFSSPSDHGEGGWGEVELGEGEAGDTAKWY